MLAILNGVVRGEEIPPATPEEIAKLHEPEALRADLDAIVALHERTNPNPWQRKEGRPWTSATNPQAKLSSD